MNLSVSSLNFVNRASSLKNFAPSASAGMSNPAFGRKVVTPENATPADLWCMGKEYEPIVDNWVRNGDIEDLMDNYDVTIYYNKINRPDKSIDVLMKYIDYKVKNTMKKAEKLSRAENITRGQAFRTLFKDEQWNVTEPFYDGFAVFSYLERLKPEEAEKYAKKLYSSLKNIPTSDNQWKTSLSYIKSKFERRGYEVW